MDLRETIKKILKEEEKEFSTKFKRRVPLFKDFIKHCFVFQNPCDYENFAHFMLGIQSEIHEYASGVYDDDNTNTPDWLTYEEGVDFVETHMIDELKDYYYEMCPKEDLYEVTYRISFINEDEINTFNKMINKMMKKHHWWKGIEIRSLSYNETYRSISLDGELTIDEEWAEKQWKNLYGYSEQLTFKEDKEKMELGDIMTDDEYKELAEELRKLFQFAFSVKTLRFPITQLQLKFSTN
jgi:hypothetical protein